MSRKFINMIGKVYGRLTVLSQGDKNIFGHSTWWCLCECGKFTNKSGNNLRSGATKSCGCLLSETTSKRMYKHGYWHTRLYKIWFNIKERCCNTSSISYHYYGGRGIAICSEWLNLENFITWALNNGYNDKLQIDRIDNDGGYQPDNCRFITAKENTCNRRNNILININGLKKCLSEWAEIINIKYKTLWQHHKRFGELMTVKLIMKQLYNN